MFEKLPFNGDADLAIFVLAIVFVLVILAGLIGELHGEE